MTNLQALAPLMQYIGENIALFCGGLFTGSAFYICLTERPPRTSLGIADLLTLSRANAGRTNALLGVLAAMTALTALLASFTGAGASWLAGGLAHLAAVALLATKLPEIAKELHELGGEDEAKREGEKLLDRQTAYFSALCLMGLIAQYLFIVSPL